MNLLIPSLHQPEPAYFKKGTWVVWGLALNPKKFRNKFSSCCPCSGTYTNITLELTQSGSLPCPCPFLIKRVSYKVTVVKSSEHRQQEGTYIVISNV